MFLGTPDLRIPMRAAPFMGGAALVLLLATGAAALAVATASAGW